MELNDDFISLQEFKDNEKTIFEYLDAGMRKTLSLYALSHHSKLIDLSPVNIQAIKKNYPNKVRITLEKNLLFDLTNIQGGQVVMLFIMTKYYLILSYGSKNQRLIKYSRSQQSIRL
ncbi:MAG: hypothetical protein U1E78_02360 [Gammaproteobacteria bacterium]